MGFKFIGPLKFEGSMVGDKFVPSFSVAQTDISSSFPIGVPIVSAQFNIINDGISDYSTTGQPEITTPGVPFTFVNGGLQLTGAPAPGVYNMQVRLPGLVNGKPYYAPLTVTVE